MQYQRFFTITAALISFFAFFAESEAAVRSVLQSPANSAIPEIDVYRRSRPRKRVRDYVTESPEEGGAETKPTRGGSDYAAGKRYWSEGKAEEARRHFERAARAGYRPAFARLFLAKIAIQRDDLDEAEIQFRTALSLGGNVPKMVAHYYLGLIEMNRGKSLAAIDHFSRSEEISRSLPQVESIRTFQKNTADSLDPYRNSSWHFYAITYAFYNSNIGQVTFEELPPFKVRGLDTYGNTTQLGTGFSTALTNTVQTQLGYHLSFNKNFEPETRLLQYFSHSPYLHFLVNPLSTTTWGARFSFGQTYLDRAPVSQGFDLDRLSVNATGNLFLRNRLGIRWLNEISVGTRPHRNFQSDAFGGRALSLNGTLTYFSDSDWFNPDFRLNTDRNDLNEKIYSYRSIGWGATNRFLIGPGHSLALSGDYLVSRYSNEPYRRIDYLLLLKAAWLKHLGGSWSLLGDVNYTRNASNLAFLFSYNMLVVDLGLQLSL